MISTTTGELVWNYFIVNILYNARVSYVWVFFGATI